MGVYMLKRILSIILCLSIFLFSLCCYAPVSVKADVSIYDKYKTIYDGYDFSSVISQHKNFNFTDKGGTKHPISYCVGGGWNYYFGRGGFIKDDVTLNYFLSWYACKGYNSDNKSVGTGLLSMINSKLGLVADVSSSIMESVLLSRSDIDFEYNEDNGLTILSDSVDKLREQLKKQYYESIGVAPLISSGTDVKKAVTNLRDCFEFEEDYIDTMQRISDYDYSVSLKLSSCGFCFAFKRDSFNYCYFGSDNLFCLNFVDNDLNIIELPYVYLLNQEYIAGYNVYSFPNIVKYSTVSSTSNGNRRYFTLKNFAFNVHCNSDSTEHVELYKNIYGNFYNSSNSDFLIFNSYESLYNYVHGSQNAYLSSKVEEKGEDIKISIDDMNTNISDKMDELIDSINNGKGSMSADELQKAIDKGLASLSGKMDDIKDNTQETNNKLDSLLTVMQSQNEILLNILGVTTDIYTVVSSKDDEQDKSYDINYVQAVFNTMFKGLKNAVLYGENTVKQDVNQDNDDVNSLVTDVSPDKVNYRNGLFGKFPFSVPYQLYEWLQVLCAEPVAPSFTLSYDFLMKDFIDEDNRDNFKLIIDLNDDKYKEWADLMRSGEKLAFTIYMAIATYNRFKNEV